MTASVFCDCLPEKVGNQEIYHVCQIIVRFLFPADDFFNNTNYSQIFKYSNKSILSKIDILFVIIISILLLSVFGQQPMKQNDDLCPEIRSVTLR
jgi:hypothetical protein